MFGECHRPLPGSRYLKEKSLVMFAKLLLGVVALGSFPLLLHSQCDTIPKLDRWWGIDGISDVLYEMEFPDTGSAIIHITDEDDLSVPLPFGIFPGDGTQFSYIAGLNAKAKYTFSGTALFDSDYRQLTTDTFANHQRCARGDLRGLHMQHLLLPDPASPSQTNPERLWMFYTETGNSTDSLCFPFRKAYFALYNVFTRDFSAFDSILFEGGAHAWAAQRHPSGDGWWILSTTIFPSPRIYAFRLSSTGLDTTPVVSLGGGAGPAPFQDGFPFTHYYQHITNLHLSPSGDRIAVARQPEDIPFFFFDSHAPVELWNFDAITGKATFQRDAVLQGEGIYGTRFSPRGDYIYAFNFEDSIPSNPLITLIRQKLDSPEALSADPLLPPPGDTVAVSGLEMSRWDVGVGPNGRMYWGYGKVIEITNPDGLDIDTTTIFQEEWVGAGVVHYPIIPVDLPSMRKPRARLIAAKNALACGQSAQLAIPTTAYLDATAVSFSAGPGLEIVGQRRSGTTGDTIEVRMTPAGFASGSVFIASAYQHPCRTYRDTLTIHSFVQPTLDTIETCQGEPILVHDVLRPAAVASYTASFPSVLTPGCDSASTVAVRLLPHDSVSVDAVAMTGDTLSGVVIGAVDTSFTVTFPNAGAQGCDLVIDYRVTIDTTSSSTQPFGSNLAEQTRIDLIAPNPFSGTLRARIDAARGSTALAAALGGGGVHWTIHSLATGQRVWQEQTADGQLEVAEAEAWASGMYVLVVRSLDGKARGVLRVVKI